MSLTKQRKTWKPLDYPWALEAFEIQNKMHWLPEEVSLHTDLTQFNNVITKYEKQVITNILRFFTQADVEVGRCYIDYYLLIFKCPEIRMMLTSFANMEGIHVWGYSYLITSLHLPDSEYSEFMNYKSMADKYDFMQHFSVDNPFEIGVTLAIVSGFVEGVMLFSSFAVLISFSANRYKFGVNCLTGVGQIVSFSIRDETLHCLSVMKLLNAYIEENNLNRLELEKRVHENARIIYSIECAFIDDCLFDGDLPFLSKDDLKHFIRYLIDLRLKQMRFAPLFNENTNPLEWMDNILFAKELANFFENTPTNYTKSDFVNTKLFDD